MSEIETQQPERLAPDVMPLVTPVPVDRPDPAGSPKTTRRGRVRKWDREQPPHDWRFWVASVGKTLIAVGLLMFSFVGYQLYGTAIETAAAQSELEDQFEQQLALVEPVSPDVADDADTDAAEAASQTGDVDSSVESGDGAVGADDETTTREVEDAAPQAVPVAAQNIPTDLENGDAIAKIEIPRIGLDDIVVAGVETSDLKRGPGHFPDTPLPGQFGNSAIAGHRTTYGQPFRNVDQLQVGDEIRMTTLSGVFVYKVTGQAIVEPSEYQVVATTDPTKANLTLTSCHPVFTARQRIVIFSELDRTESAPIGEPVINYGRPDVVDTPPEIPGDVDLPAGDDGAQIATEPDVDVDPSDDVDATIDPAAPVDDANGTGSLADDAAAVDAPLGSEAVNEGIADAFSDGWFSDPGANLQVGLWGLVLAGVAIGAFAISRRFRRDLLGLAVGLIPFALALYFFFQNVNRLLPPNL